MLIPVILSGGTGTRLWPVSRTAWPKPFMRLPDGNNLLHQACTRAALVANAAPILTVTSHEHYWMGKEVLQRACGADTAAIFMLEPFGRNTAPAIALAALCIAQRFGPDACMLVQAADHLISNQAAFADAVTRAYTLAQQGWLVTFGIMPDTPHTGYGYIQTGETLPGDGRKVKRFVEKPDKTTAQQYLADGNYLWNSGMFCFSARCVLAELQQYAPDLMHAAVQCWQAVQNPSSNTIRLPAETFQNLPDISIDYALMEHSRRVAVVSADMGWSDIGSWVAVQNLTPPDENNNRAVGNAIFIDSAHTYVHSESRLVATLGVNNLLIIDTPDALLVAHADKAQDVKKAVSQIKAQNHEASLNHQRVVRPWGSYTILAQGKGFKVKQIDINPQSCLSLQLHHRRSEHWAVVSGVAQVINGDTEITLKVNQSTYIPAGHKHRLCNPGKAPLVIIEVQNCDYLEEDDFVRFQDDYERI